MSLSRDELARLSQLLDQALDLPRAERAAWLGRLGEADATLRPQLEAMLAEADDETTGGASEAPGLIDVLDALPGLAGVAAEAKMASADPGLRQIGPYCLLRTLGQGGMGTVWLAERVDGALQRAVALKLPHISSLHQPALAHRFERERDILAALEHPHIARLYDAGVTPAGQPYLALEYVEGLPITTYCDEKQLPLRARIDLFLQVLEAIQYAHARLVVHRDLKPSNIFVTHDGQVRLLDFGIATLLDDGESPRSHAPTEWAHAPMTPDYASPEQIAHQPIGTSSDVYSLGVVFYELVTGQRPYRLPRETRGALEDAILGIDPTKPSRMPTTETAAAQRALRPAGLRRQLRGDLDNIALMALRKNPAERYPSAEAFKQDLKRWLRNKPVHAHPGSWWYRTRKFIQRHKLPVAATALAGTGMLAALAVALDQAEAARRESQRTKAVQDFLVGLFNEADPARAQGRELTVRDLLARGERDLQARLVAEPDLNVALSGVLIDIYDKLGDHKPTLPLAEARRDLMVKSHGEGSIEHAQALITLAHVHKSLGHHDKSLSLLNEARPMLLARHPADAADLLRVDQAVADNLLDLNRHDEGRSLLQRLLPSIERQYGPDSYEVAQARVRLATSLASEGRKEDATKALQDLQPLLEKDWRSEGMGAAALRADVGYTFWQMRLFPEAIRTLEKAIAELDRLAGHNNTLSIQAGRTLGMAYMDSGQYLQADKIFASNVERSRQVYGHDDSETALNLSFHVMTLNRVGDADGAEESARESVRLAQAQGSSLSASEVRGFTRRLASALVVNGKPEEALRWFDRLVAEEEAAGQKDTRHASTLMLRAGALNALGRGREAGLAGEAAVEAWRQAGAALGAAGHVGTARAQLNAALGWITAGDTARAEPLIASAEKLLQDHHTGPHPEQQLAALVRAQWLRAVGRSTEADTTERQARARYRELAGAEAPVPLRIVL
ncbi:serine/threonine-protein kinase [Ideonella sp. DXS29W]|uniref:Serine/threonine-protein kinase n=1 Tax=Ideonella lacteola TaxID=2984193 RepID=A0ABU9BVV3_9BURK